MNSLYDALVLPWTEPAFQKALLGGSLVAIVCGVVGCFVILRRMAFLGDALSHAMLAGVTAGYLFMQVVFGIEAHAPAMLIGSMIAGFVTVTMISFVSRVSRIKEDTAIGVMYTGIFAFGGILASVFSDRIHLDLYHFITGMVLGIEDADLWVMATVAASVLLIIILFFRFFQITTFDPVMAASLGISVTAFDYLLTTCTSLVVVSAVSIVGVILVVGLLVTPAATAYLLCNRLRNMMILAAFFGVTSVVGGLYASINYGNVASGPAIVVVSTLQFLLVLAIAPRYGLIAGYLRRRRQVPQQIVEDILGSFRYYNAQQIPTSEIARHMQGPTDLVQRSLRSMERSGLLDLRGDMVALTREGRQESRRMIRAHRLWESYLEHLGTPADKVHEMAHQLEHVHDEDAVDYLDDKLGHPLTDPHGKDIPEDFVHLVPGKQVKASLLREGHRGEVVAVANAAIDSGLAVGDQIAAGARSSDGSVWTFQLDGGKIVELEHDAADAVTVRLKNQV